MPLCHRNPWGRCRQCAKYVGDRTAADALQFYRKRVALISVYNAIAVSTKNGRRQIGKGASFTKASFVLKKQMTSHSFIQIEFEFLSDLTARPDDMHRNHECQLLNPFVAVIHDYLLGEFDFKRRELTRPRC